MTEEHDRKIIEERYKLLVGILIPLNHERYKSYFTQFAVMHFGLFLAIKQFKGLFRWLSVVGIILCVIWLLVLWGIRSDIKNKWKLVKQHENKDSFQNLKLYDEEQKSQVLQGSILMLFVPFLFIVVYVMIMTLCW
ncbi:MAG: RipA family octameric membrane protein [Nitrospiria bacterium]